MGRVESSILSVSLISLSVTGALPVDSATVGVYEERSGIPDDPTEESMHDCASSGSDEGKTAS